MTKDRIWTLASRKFSGEATDSELAELDDLIKLTANCDLYMQAIQEYWQTLPEADGEFLEATYHLHLNRLKEKGFDFETDKEINEIQSLYFDNKGESENFHYWKKILVSTGVAAILVTLFVFLFNIKNATSVLPVEKIAQSEVSTKSGSRTKIQLPDGTAVWLNGGSKLVYDNHNFGNKIREVTLTGEGYFDVVKMKDIPFLIHANKIDIRVIGTAFNVKAYPGERNIETSLIRGSIEVTMKGRADKIMMKANDKLIVSNEFISPVTNSVSAKKYGSIVVDSTFVLISHLTARADENTIVETAWVDNKLVFDNETFEDVALKMERWYGVSIRFNDSRVKSIRLTGSFEKETIAEALTALQISTPFFKYKISNQQITIFK